VRSRWRAALHLVGVRGRGRAGARDRAMGLG
jgi:hypothetical protein